MEILPQLAINQYFSISAKWGLKSCADPNLSWNDLGERIKVFSSGCWNFISYLTMAVWLIHWKNATCCTVWKSVTSNGLLQSEWRWPIFTDPRVFTNQGVEHLTRTCYDKINSMPCSNFQSSAMFDGSESVDVEGGGMDSTVASSISACKKVKNRARSHVFVLGWKSVSTQVCPSVCLLCDTFSTTSSSCFFLCSCACAPVCHICVLVTLSVCVFPAGQEIFISSHGVPVTPRGRVIRGTARPSGQPSRFII